MQQANASAANTARNKKVTGGVITGVGLATVAGGLVWYFLAAAGGRARRPAPVRCASRVDPALSPGFAGVALSGAF